MFLAERQENDMSGLDLELVTQPSDEDYNAIRQPLIDYNASKVDGPWGPLAIMLRDEAGTVRGGLWASYSYDWLFVELLVVPEAFRGQGLGARMLQQAEGWARERGCVGVWLDTFSFQAPGFYEKQGYTVFGVLDQYPGQTQRFFLRKML